MERNIQKIGLVNWVLLLVAGAIAAYLARYTNSATGYVGAVYIGLGFLAAVVSYFQMRLETREQFEKLEYDELRKSKGGSALFTDVAADTFPARRSREQFDRILVPVFTILLFGLQVVSIYWLWKKFSGTIQLPTANTAQLSMTLYGMLALVLFLVGKYSAGLARLEGQRLLRPGASYLLLSAFACFLMAVSEAATLFRFEKVDLYMSRVLLVALGFIAIETLFSLVFEAYRPRVKGQAARLLYESRLVGLLGQPGGLISTAAQALDYQFGFKVSETGFYRFVEKQFATLFLAQLGALWLCTTFVIIEPQEQALQERFGKRGTVLEPGLHFKLPWPIDQVHRYPTRQIQSFVIGIVHDPDKEKEKTLLWTVKHYKEEFHLLVASRDGLETNTVAGGEQSVPVNLLSASIPVQFQITNLTQWAYNHANAALLLEKLATREVVNYLVSVDMDNIMSAGRMPAAQELKQRIQASADRHQIGASILFVGLQDIHPPVDVAKEYELVIGAIQQKEAKILEAEGYQAGILPMAQAEAFKLVNEAEAYRLQKASAALAYAGQFTNQLSAYKASPQVFMQRTYLDTLGRASAGSRKYVLTVTNTEDTVVMNLEEELRPDLLNIKVPSANPTTKK